MKATDQLRQGLYACRRKEDPYEFLVRGGKLCRADVVLVHSCSKANPFYWFLVWLIRKLTDSYWNHVGLIYVVRQQDAGYDNTFVIESEARGIDIHNVSKYLKRPGHDIGIKRLEASWYAGRPEDKGSELWFKRQVRGFALDEIDAIYDWRKLLRTGLGIVGLGKAERGRYNVGGRPHRLTRVLKDGFICSGFVQYAYYQAAKQLGDEKKLDSVWFNPNLRTEPSPKGDELVDILLGTTPEDLARTPKLTWKYFVKNGHIWEIGDSPDFPGGDGSKVMELSELMFGKSPD